MTKKIIAALLAAIMTLSMSVTTFAAAPTNTSGNKRYYMDLEAMSEREFEDCSVNLRFFVNGQETILYRDGRTYKPDGTPIDEKDLGSALLFDYRPNGKLDQDSMPVTFVPIRRVANALGLSISWNDETKNVVLDTPKGRIEFPVGATSITAPDGTTYEEQTYRFPNGDPINITSVREGRVYVTVRFISTFCMPDATYKWKGTSELNVIGTIDGTTVQKTYGLNENYMNVDGDVNWPALPNFNEAVESAGTGYDWDVGRSVIHVDTSVNNVGISLHIAKYAGRDELEIGGFDGTEGYVRQLPIIDGLLKDMICDADRESIMALLNEISEHQSVGYNQKVGLSDEAKKWTDNFKLNYTLEEVNVVFDKYLSQLTITGK